MSTPNYESQDFQRTSVIEIPPEEKKPAGKIRAAFTLVAVTVGAALGLNAVMTGTDQGASSIEPDPRPAGEPTQVIDYATPEQTTPTLEVAMSPQPSAPTLETEAESFQVPTGTPAGTEPAPARPTTVVTPQVPHEPDQIDAN